MVKSARVLLAVTLLLTGLTATAPATHVALATPACPVADPVADAPAGAGEPSDPYRIATPEHLMWLSATPGEWDKEFLQVADIDFGGSLATCDSDRGWSPIGNTSTLFTGVYDGQGHSITGLFIDRPIVSGVGFFGRTRSAEIRHLHLVDVDITGSHEVGALIGTNPSGATTTVYDVSATGDVISARSAEAADVGGLFGYVFDITITFARAHVTVTAAGRNVGGLIGDGTNGTTVSRSWATGSVTSTGDEGQIGGLAGLFRGSGISDSYATGAVTRGGTDGNPGAGGLIGRVSSTGSQPIIKNSYATGPVLGTNCPTDCDFLIGVDLSLGDEEREQLRVALPTEAGVSAIRTAAGSWVAETNPAWILPADPGLPTLRTPPGRPVISELTRSGDSITVTVTSVEANDENDLPVTAYELVVGSTTAIKDSDADLALPSSFDVELDADTSGPKVLRIRAVSGSVAGPSVSFGRPSAPTGFSATTLGSEFIGLDWAAPSDTGTTGAGTAPAIDYRIEFGVDGSFDSSQATASTTATLTGLAGATSYSARVSARNVIGFGPPAPSVTALSLPAAPTILTSGGLAIGNGEVRVLWERPSGGNEIDGYVVTASPGGATCSTTAPTRSCTVTGLTNGTDYSFSVIATNASGSSPASSTAGPVAPVAALVTAPTAPTFTPSTSNQDPGAFEISGFDPSDTLLVSVGFVDPPAGTTFKLTSISGLTGGFGYENLGAAFTQVSFTATQAAANTALAGLRVDTGAALGELSIRVTAVRNVPGVFYNPINDHFYEQFTTSVLAREAVDDAAARARFGVPGYLATVTDEQEQEFVHDNVDASNIWLGASDDFQMLNRIDVTGAPFAGQEGAEGKWFWITGPETGQQFWDGAAAGSRVGDRYENWCDGEPNDNGSPSEEFLLDKWNGAKCWNDWGMFESGRQRYLVEYSASWNQTATAASSGSPWGEIGPYMGVASATLTALVDRAPRAVAVAAGDTELTATWAPPAVGTVTGYTVTATPPTGSASTCTTGAEATSCTVTGLTNGTPYTVTVTAAFDSGPDATSLSVQGTPVPAPPSGILATPWNGQIRVDWTASASTGVTAYQVERRTNVTDWTLAVEVADTATFAVVPNLTNGTAYDIRVRALSGSAAGPASAQATTTPFAFQAIANSLVRLNLDANDALLPESGSLATRTQRRQLTRTGTGPEFTMSFAGGSGGVGAYSYVTDVAYAGAAQLREGDERKAFATSGGTGSPTFSHSVNASTPDDVGVRTNVLQLQSEGWCSSSPGNSFVSPPGTATAGEDLTTYCSMFGPEAWSPPFSATADDGISFDIAARLVSDDYEYYAYLVAVSPIDDTTGKSPGDAGWVPTYDHGGGKADEATDPTTTHTILSYGRGGRLQWTTVVGDIPAEGIYRFRFVNGSYDRTGGRLLGSQFFIDPASVKVGKLQTIGFDAFAGGSAADLVGVSSPTVLTEATSTSGLPVNFSSLTPAVCTVQADGSALEVLRFGVCSITANQAGGEAGGTFWAPASTVTRTFTVTAVPQTLSVAAIGPFDLFKTSDFVATATTTAGLPIALDRDGSSSAVCSRESIASAAELTTAVFTLLAAGTCSLSAAQSGTGVFTSGSASRSVTVHDTRLSTLAPSSGTLTPALTAGVSDYAVIVPAGLDALAFEVVPSATGATVASTGITPDGPSFAVPLTAGGRTVAFVITQGGATRTIQVTVIRPALPAPVVVAPTPPPLPPGPVLTSGLPPRPSPAPTARVGDRDVTVVPTPAGTTRQEGPTTVSTATILEAGTVSLALDLTGAGEVRTSAGTAPQLSVARDSVARTSGGGLLPGTQIQAWLPLAGGTTVRPVTTIAVAEDGTFTGELPFDGRTDRQTDGRPLPIGTHVLQLVGVDAAGERIVIEQTIRIEQPAPSPEPDRSAGAPPTLLPGASIATNAGVPEAVTVVPLPDQRQARVEGSGWTMAVDIPSSDGSVNPSDSGGALIELVEEDVALVSGDGFLPGTRADVWLFSTPTLLGTVTIGSNGTFTGQVEVTGIATGQHTLQLQGVGQDGYVRAANLGVVVVPRDGEEPAAAPEAEATPPPSPAPAAPDDRVEVIAAAGEETRSSPTVWVALLVLIAGASWWVVGRRRRDREPDEPRPLGT